MNGYTVDVDEVAGRIFSMRDLEGKLLVQVIASGHDCDAIVRALMSHDALVAALEAARAFGSQGETHEGVSVSWLIDEALKKARPNTQEGSPHI